MKDKKPGILIINQVAIAKDQRLWVEAKAFAEAGYSVSVICPGDSKTPSCEVLNNIAIFSYKEPPVTGGAFSFFYEFAYCWIRALILSVKVLIQRGFKTIYAANPPDTYFLLAGFYKLLGKRFVFAQHDLCPELYLAKFSKNPNKALLAALKFLEKLSYRTADMVINTNMSHKKIAMERGRCESDRVVVIPSGPDVKRLYKVEPDESLKKGSDSLVCYLGYIGGDEDGVEHLIRAIHYLVNGKGEKNVHFGIVGGGDGLEFVERLASELDVEKYITFTGWTNDEELIRSYLSTAEVCVSTHSKTNFGDISTPMKIFEYMAVEKPIVAFDLTETRFIAQEAALYVNDDPISLADGILELLADEERRIKMGRFGYRRIKNELSWDILKEDLLEGYSRLIEDRSPEKDGAIQLKNEC